VRKLDDEDEDEDEEYDYTTRPSSDDGISPLSNVMKEYHI
jgi:hypothetical protein